MSTLVVAEKPSVAYDIAKALGGFRKEEGYFVRGDAYISWAVGHLFTLQEPEDYQAAWKKWDASTLPLIPSEFRTKLRDGASSQFSVLKKLFGKADLVVNACDAGREGELIFRLIANAAKYKGAVKRFWASSLTEDAIKKEFGALRESFLYDGLYESAWCRMCSDWLVGINATRAMTVKHGSLLSIGRVQTPTLAMIVQREKQILSFVPEDYWEVRAKFHTDPGDYEGKWVKDGKTEIKTQALAQAIAKKVDGKTGRVQSLARKQTKESPPLPFDLTSLQQEANRRFGFSAQRTLAAAQSLYEKWKAVTYPRTDSRYITKEVAATLRKRLEALRDGSYFIHASRALAAAPGLALRCVNPQKVHDHHAIIPTEKTVDRGALSADEDRVYDLVAKQFLSMFFPPAEWDNTEILTLVEGETFITKWKRLVSPGWREVWDEEEKTDPIPGLAVGDPAKVMSVEVVKDQTKPPARYTEGTLLKAMETAGKDIEEDDLRDAMKDSGLGTPATRAAIIERLKDVQYIYVEQKNLRPTQKGIECIEALTVEELKSPELTGRWEKMLSDVGKRAMEPGEFMEQIEKFTRETTKALLKTQSAYFEHVNSGVLGPCPLCGGDVVENHKAYGCSNYKNGCKFVIWKTILKKRIGRDHAVSLLARGETDLIAGFVSKNGKRFSAKLRMDEEGQITFEFPAKRFYSKRGSSKR